VRVAVVTDSASNLPREVIAEHGIHVVPMILKFGEEVLYDGVDLDVQDFYRRLVDEQVPASTSAPSAGDYRDVFERALADADVTVCVTVASFLSVSHEAAVQAAASFGERVRVVDSGSASLGEGLAVLEAARAASDGAGADQVAARAADVASRTAFVATIDTFEFLRRGGRVNALMAYAATTLNIKPVFAVRGGKVEQLGRPRTRARALDRIVEEVRRGAGHGRPRIGVAHANCAEEAAALAERLRAEFDPKETLVSAFTPLMGAHTGPGVLGVAFWR